MSAERLREAAGVLRQRAESARDATGAGDWHVAGLDWDGYYRVRSSGGYVCSDATEDEAAYIATMSPPVALALATRLLNEAALVDGANLNPDVHSPLNHARLNCMNAVADAILGGVA